MMNISSMNIHDKTVKDSHLKAIFVVLLMIVSAFAILAMLHLAIPATNNQSSQPTATAPTTIKLVDSKVGVYTGPYDSISAVDRTTQVSVMVALGYQNVAQLNQFLSNVQNPASSQYHHYLTQDQFINTFSPSTITYNGLVNFFTQQGLAVKTYNDRVAINLVGTLGQMEHVFHTQIYNYKVGSETFYAPGTSVSLATPYAHSISTIQGLNDQWHAKLNPLFSGTGSGETLYGSDMQVAYQLNQLYPNGYPTNLTIATILWSGYTHSQSNEVGPYYPADIVNYWSQVIPSNEPQPHAYADPIGGAPAPGISSTKDTTQANYESTLDLEMVGSVAPGASVVEVYGPQATTTYLDQCFAEILNPSSTAPAALHNTVAISNSWGGSDSLDSLWTQYNQQAAAVGISVFASSGDNGKTTSPSFPSTNAYASYGTVAVGGSADVLSGTASIDGTGTTGISSETVWWNTPSAGDGSQSGVSSVYAMPSWQSGSSDANGVITAIGNGRATADISAVAANMEIYITSSSGTGSMVTLWGTSVASPLVAGVVAVMDQYMGTNEGFMAPAIYQLGQNQYNGQYTSSTNPFFDVTTGATQNYAAHVGYDLPTGWGSINALNFINAQTGGLPTYSVTFTQSGLPSGTSWSVTLGGSTQSSTTSTITFTETDGSYAYTVGSVSGYASSPASGSVTVNGANVNTAITFTAATTYAVSFTESGLASGTSWSVTLGGSTQSSTTNTITFNEVAGTYSYTVNSVTGYTSSPSSGSVSVSANTNTGITFTAVSTPSVVAYSYVAGPATYYSLPEAEQFNIGSTAQKVNFISLILSGSGTVSVSIGSALWGADVVPTQSINVVSGQTNYTVSFSSATLAGGTSYYLSVTLTSGSVTWAYTTSATALVGATQDYWYHHKSLRNDNSYPDLYSVGYNSNGPAVVVSSTANLNTVGTTQMATTQASTVSSTSYQLKKLY